ncbi:MAG: thioesterase family protein [Pseudomonadota bacterium]
MPADFTYLFRVRYSECDAQKVVFNGKYAEYVDLAATEFIRALWGEHDNLFAKGVDFQVVSLTINWQASARFDDVLAISVKTSHIGNTSYRFSFEFTNQTSNRVIATAEAVYVMVDAENLTKMSIPDDMRATLQAGAQGVVINHAGT